jgi:hypothetical protein
MSFGGPTKSKDCIREAIRGEAREARGYHFEGIQISPLFFTYNHYAFLMEAK